MARSRVKNLRVPKGREDEYEKDAQGNLVHTRYGEDDEFDAVVLPSARGAGRHGTGGQHGAHFDPLGRDLKQNVIVFGESGMPETVTETTGREMAANTPKGVQIRDGNKGSHDLTKEEADQLGESAEAQYRAMVAGRGQQAQPQQAPAPATSQLVAGSTGAMIEEGLVAKKAAKKAKKKSRRAVKSDGVAEQGSTVPGAAQQEPNFVPVEVEIEAPFGRLRQTFSGLFRDGSNLILWTDARQVPSVYSLPKPDKPMEITIRWQDRVIPCVHAGIQFTLPHAPVTFTVLFIDEGQMDGEG